MHKQYQQLVSLVLFMLMTFNLTLTGMEARGMDESTQEFEDRQLELMKLHNQPHKKTKVAEWIIDIITEEHSPLSKLFTDPDHRNISQKIALYLKQELHHVLYGNPLSSMKRNKPLAPMVGLFQDDNTYITVYHFVPKTFGTKKYCLASISLPSGEILNEKVSSFLTEEEVSQLTELGYNGYPLYKLSEDWFYAFKHSQDFSTKTSAPELKSSDQYDAQLGALVSPSGTYATVENKHGITLYQIDVRLKEWMEKKKQFTLMDYVRLQELILLKQRGKENSVAAAKLWALLNETEKTEDIAHAFEQNTMQLVPTASLKERILSRCNPYTPEHYKIWARGELICWGVGLVALLNLGAASTVALTTDVKTYLWVSLPLFWIVVGIRLGCLAKNWGRRKR